MRALLVGIALLLSGTSYAQERAVELAQLERYADNAILDAASHGHKDVLLVFGNAPLDDIETVADELRDRGYRLDEQSVLLNPRVIRVRFLDVRKVASRA